MSSPAASVADPSHCQEDSFGSCSSAADGETLDDQTKVDTDADKIAGKTTVMAGSENSDADSVASCSRRTDMNQVGSSLPGSSEEGVKDVDAVGVVLCLLHGLSHCSYHESSLLLLADHAAYRAAVDLFAALWHKLQTSPHHSDKTQAHIFPFYIRIYDLFIHCESKKGCHPNHSYNFVIS